MKHWILRHEKTTALMNNSKQKFRGRTPTKKCKTSPPLALSEVAGGDSTPPFSSELPPIRYCICNLGLQAFPSPVPANSQIFLKPSITLSSSPHVGHYQVKHDHR